MTTLVPYFLLLRKHTQLSLKYSEDSLEVHHCWLFFCSVINIRFGSSSVYKSFRSVRYFFPVIKLIVSLILFNHTPRRLHYSILSLLPHCWFFWVFFWRGRALGFGDFLVFYYYLEFSIKMGCRILDNSAGKAFKNTYKAYK